MEWKIDSDCKEVHVKSSQFDTEEGYDIVTIDGTQFSGKVHINQYIIGSFYVTFKSDFSVTASGFAIHWKCR